MANTLFAFVRGFAAGEIAEREAKMNSPLSQDEWITTRAHFTRAIVENGEFPKFSRVVRDAKTPHDSRLAEKGLLQGLDHILDGFAVRVGSWSLKLKK